MSSPFGRSRHPGRRLLTLLTLCVDIIRENVTTNPHDAEEPLNVLLTEQDATPTECEWLGPRLSAFAAGFAQGHIAGQLHRDVCLWEHPKEHLDTRRN